MSTRPAITIPRPHVPYGPQGVTEDQADVNYLREAARTMEDFYKPYGSNLRATIVKLISDTADAIEAARDVEQEGDTLAGCTGSEDCPAPAHQHGCFADLKGHCNEPQAHPAEPTTVIAEQIEKAAMAINAHHEYFMPVWSELVLSKDRANQHRVRRDREYAELALRAAGFRIEGDPS